MHPVALEGACGCAVAVEPGREQAPCAANGFVEFAAVRAVLLHKRPECRGVVEVDEMAEFVQEHVLDHVRWEEEHLLINADGPVA